MFGNYAEYGIQIKLNNYEISPFEQLYDKLQFYTLKITHSLAPIGLYRENAIAIESEARDPFGGNVYVCN